MKNNSNETQIRTLVEDWAKAVRARDMDGVLAQHAKDVVMFDVPLPLQSKGISAYKKTWELFFANNAGGEGSFNIEELKLPRATPLLFVMRF